MKLYEIDQAIMACLESDTDEAIDLETGEILQLEALQMERVAKLEGVACYIKNMLAEAEAMKAEKNALAKREIVARNKAARLKAWLNEALNGEKLNTPKVAISYRTSETVEITDEDQLVMWALGYGHKDLLTFTAPCACASAVKSYLKNTGDEVPGAALVQRKHIQIK